MRTFLARHAFTILAFVFVAWCMHFVAHRVVERATKVVSSSPLVSDDNKP